MAGIIIPIGPYFFVVLKQPNCRVMSPRLEHVGTLASRVSASKFRLRVVLSKRQKISSQNLL